MIIDTVQLKIMVNRRDDGVDFNTCSMARLNALEKRAVDSIAAIETVEFLAQDLLKEKLNEQKNTGIQTDKPSKR